MLVPNPHRNRWINNGTIRPTKTLHSIKNELPKEFHLYEVQKLAKVIAVIVLFIYGEVILTGKELKGNFLYSEDGLTFILEVIIWDYT